MLREGMSEKDAIRRAEIMMKTTQASSNVADRPHILNTKTGRFGLTFQTFSLNAYNNFRYDLVRANIAKNGTYNGTLITLKATSFIVLARILESKIRGLLFQLFYGEEEEKEEWYVSVKNAIIANIPILNNLYGWDGELAETVYRNPVVETFGKLTKAVGRISEKGLSTKSVADVFFFYCYIFWCCRNSTITSVILF